MMTEDDWGGGGKRHRTIKSDQPERGAQEPWLRRSVVTGGCDGSGMQEGSVAATEMQDNGYSDSGDTAEM